MFACCLPAWWENWSFDSFNHLQLHRRWLSEWESAFKTAKHYTNPRHSSNLYSIDLRLTVKWQVKIDNGISDAGYAFSDCTSQDNGLLIRTTLLNVYCTHPYCIWDVIVKMSVMGLHFPEERNCVMKCFWCYGGAGQSLMCSSYPKFKYSRHSCTTYWAKIRKWGGPVSFSSVLLAVAMARGIAV